MSKIMLATFLIAFYLAVMMFTPIVGRSILSSQNPDTLKNVNTNNAISTIQSLYSNGFVTEASWFSGFLIIFNLFAAVLVVFFIRG